LLDPLWPTTLANRPHNHKEFHQWILPMPIRQMEFQPLGTSSNDLTARISPYGKQLENLLNFKLSHPRKF